MSQVPSSTGSNNPTHEELTALELQVVQLRNAVDEAVAAAKRRNSISFIISLVVVLLILLYMGFIYSQVSTIDAQLAANFAKAKLVEYIPKAGAQLESKLTSQVPDVMDDLEAKAQEAPKFIVSQIKERGAAELAKIMPKLEDELYGAIKEALKSSSERVKEVTNAPPDKRVGALLDLVSDTYIEQTKPFVAHVYAQYLEQAEPIVGHLDHLATGKDLSPREQNQRLAIQYFLAIMERYEKESASKPGTSENITIPPIEKLLK